MYLFTANKRVY